MNCARIIRNARGIFIILCDVIVIIEITTIGETEKKTYPEVWTVLHGGE